MVANQKASTSPRKRQNTDARQREALKQRTRVLLATEVSFISNPAFREMDAEGVWKRELDRTEVREATSNAPSGRLKMPAHLERICDTPLLSAEEEMDLFRSMNYLKFRANALRSSLNANRPSVRKLEQIEALLSRANAIRNEIVSANTRLIVSIVKKFSDEKNPFDDLLSEGISSLMKVVEKFDYDRGFRFSTYATMAVRREIYRLIQRSQRRRTRFVTGQPAVLEDQEATTEGCLQSEAQLAKVDGHVEKLFDHLDDREKFIVGARYGFVDLGTKATFSNLGRSLGISKERVRQLELRAVEKLRNTIGELGLFNELRSVVSR